MRHTPFIIIEHNRCILCRRCVRACGELVGNFTLDSNSAARKALLVADLGLPLGESICVGCGTLCTGLPHRRVDRPLECLSGQGNDVEVTKTICLGCSVGCGIDVMTRDNRLVRIEGDWDADVNQGVLCEVGRFIPMTEERERVSHPLAPQRRFLESRKAG